jgi:hypothetical protein
MKIAAPRSRPLHAGEEVRLARPIVGAAIVGRSRLSGTVRSLGRAARVTASLDEPVGEDATPLADRAADAAMPDLSEPTVSRERRHLGVGQERSRQIKRDAVQGSLSMMTASARAAQAMSSRTQSMSWSLAVQGSLPDLGRLANS